VAVDRDIRNGIFPMKIDDASAATTKDTPMVSHGTTVTFDTNTLDKAARPERHPKDPARASFSKVHEALKTGRLRGYFSDTLVTLEGIENEDRVDVFGSTRLESSSSSASKNAINMTIAVKQDRRPRHPELSKRIQAAQKIGMRALRGPARMVDGFSVKDDDGSFYERVDSVQELIARREIANEVDAAISNRGVGRRIAQSLGLEFSRRDGASGELWLQGLRRATVDERKKVQRAVAEWADADSISAHIGYKIDFFCTGDYGKGNAGTASIFDPTNRAWLMATYGVRFLTISDLAAMLA